MSTEYTHHHMNELLDDINRKREEMISIASRTGLTSEQTVQCSQELDKLLNAFQHYETQKTQKAFFQPYIKRVLLFFYGTKLKLQNY